LKEQKLGFESHHLQDSSNDDPQWAGVRTSVIDFIPSLDFRTTGIDLLQTHGISVNNFCNPFNSDAWDSSERLSVMISISFKLSGIIKAATDNPQCDHYTLMGSCTHADVVTTKKAEKKIDNRKKRP